MTGTLVGRGKTILKTKTQRKNPCNERGRDWNAAATSQGTAETASNPPRARKQQGRVTPFRS